MTDKPTPKVTFSELKIPLVGEIFLARNPSLRDFQLAQLFEILPNGQAIVFLLNADTYTILNSLESSRVLTIS